MASPWTFACDLGQYTGNHSSANDFLKDIEAYLDEELAYGAFLGPFETHPIIGGIVPHL